MIEISTVIPPISGAVIGYITNWLAIKMLFRPYEEKRFLGKRLPFTPGLIPKEKERLAQAMGHTIGEHLLTEKSLLDALLSEDMKKEVSGLFSYAVLKLSKTDCTLKEACIHFTGEENTQIFLDFLEEKLSLFLSEALKEDKLRKEISAVFVESMEPFFQYPLCKLELDSYKEGCKEFLFLEGKNLLEEGSVSQMIEKGIWEYCLRLREEEKPLRQVLSLEQIQSMKDYLAVKGPNIIKTLLSFTENEKTQEKIKKKLSFFISEYAGFMGMFLNADSIYQKVVKSVREYIENPENEQEMERTIDMAVEKILDVPIGTLAQAVTGEMRESFFKKLSDFVLHYSLRKETIEVLVEKGASYLKEKEKRKVSDILEIWEPFYKEKTAKWIEERLLTAAQENKGKKAAQKTVEQFMEQKISALTQGISKEAQNTGKALILSFYESGVKKFSPLMIQKLNISKIAEEQINSFDMAYTEKLVLSITQRELRAITWVGALLGFVIGLVPVVLRLLGIS